MPGVIAAAVALVTEQFLLLSRGDCVPPRYKIGFSNFDTSLACAQRKRLRPSGRRQRCPPQAHVLVRTSFLSYFRLRRKLCEAERRYTRRLAASRKTNRLTMYGTNSHQRLHHSVDIEGALCPHIMPLALFPPFLARQKGCARRVGALPGGNPGIQEIDYLAVCGRQSTLDTRRLATS